MQEVKIESIINNLLSHNISKSEAINMLTISDIIDKGDELIRAVLKHAVNAIYFNDRSDYIKALYSIVQEIYPMDDYGDEFIKRLFDELNRE